MKRIGTPLCIILAAVFVSAPPLAPTPAMAATGDRTVTLTLTCTNNTCQGHWSRYQGGTGAGTSGAAGLTRPPAWPHLARRMTNTAPSRRSWNTAESDARTAAIRARPQLKVSTQRELGERGLRGTGPGSVPLTCGNVVRRQHRGIVRSGRDEARSEAEQGAIGCEGEQLAAGPGGRDVRLQRPGRTGHTPPRPRGGIP